MKAYKFKIKRPSNAVVQKFEQTLNLYKELQALQMQKQSQSLLSRMRFASRS